MSLFTASEHWENIPTAPPKKGRRECKKGIAYGLRWNRNIASVGVNSPPDKSVKGNLLWSIQTI